MRKTDEENRLQAKVIKVMNRVFSVPADDPGYAEWVAGAEQRGAIPKAKLVDGAYYYGRCRNADVSRWCAARGKFTYMRTKFGKAFPEDINHYEDDNDFDLFVPVALVEPEDSEIIK